MKVSGINNKVPSFGGVSSVLTKAANINSWQQRAVLGITAMAIQPVIDMTNKEVDKETRKTSAARSFAKAFVGMSTGVAIRAGCMKLTEALFKNEKASNYLAKITAENQSEAAINAAKDFIKNQGGAKKYSSVIGTLVALGVMLYTNFAVDAPITNKITNYINAKGDNK